MATIDLLSAGDWVETLIAFVSLLGGVMAMSSGYAAHRARARRASPAAIAHRVNLGIAEGFASGVPAAVIATAILAASR